ncbi:MAG: MBOAT family protein [Duncaniella sp.]|nr:MBOAT family protein [Duncaniella sp.]
MHQLIDFDRLQKVLSFDAMSPLLFNTGLFLILFAAFIVIYSLMRRFRNVKMVFVILFSLYFYYKSSAEYCFILLGVCVSDYVLGLLMEKAGSTVWKKKLIVWINVLVNIGMLAYFKYFNLLLETISSFSTLKFDALDIILPAGISFFTFRSISYIVDIYRGHMQACHNFLDYTFYLTFFPPLLAGPVVRAKDMLPQVARNPVATREMVSDGLFLIMAGLIKKVIVADYISGNFVDRVFDNPALYSGFENTVAIFGFAIQLYCDFSGYSDMAIGLALLLGYRFMDNFDSPFKAQSPTEFWRRWHISLSTWLRDYVYIPLGGNRCSKARRNFNQMATMVIGGLWHGASWMYVIWGALHGAMLVIHKTLRQWFPSTPGAETPSWRRFLNIFVTFNLVVIIFMFFRSQSMDHVGQMTGQIINDFHISVAPQFITGYFLIVLAMVAGYAMHFSPKSWTQWLKHQFGRMHPIVQAVVLALVLLLIIQVRQSDIVPFIYLQY